MKIQGQVEDLRGARFARRDRYQMPRYVRVDTKQTATSHNRQIKQIDESMQICSKYWTKTHTWDG